MQPFQNKEWYRKILLLIFYNDKGFETTSKLCNQREQRVWEKGPVDLSIAGEENPSPSSNQYKLKRHAQNNGRYSYSYPEYFAQIDGRIVIATKPNIGNQLPLSIGDYVQVRFKTNSGYIRNYDCIIGDFKGADAPNIWGHYDGQGVVEVVYHNYNPPSGYNANANNPWGLGRVIRITKVGNYGNFT